MMIASTCIAEPVALFLFAHQDDEFGVFQKILDEQQKGHRVCCAYLTDGASNGVTSQRRNCESLSVLMHLGVQEKDIFFMGNELSIPDAGLPEHLEIAANWIREWFSVFPHLASIFVPAWEGGHHDHDALHAITVTISDECRLLERVRQFSLYNGYKRIGPLFRVFTPLPLNGKVEATRVPWANRLQFLRFCLSYPSQTKTWIGLFPFAMLHFLFNGKQLIQPVSIDRTYTRPHNGKLYYEKRGFSTWETMAKHLATWRSSEPKRHS